MCMEGCSMAGVMMNAGQHQEICAECAVRCGGDSQINDAAGDDVPLSQAGLRVRVLLFARYVGLANTAALGGDELRGRHEDRGCRHRRWLLPLGCHGCRSATPGASSFPFCPAHSVRCCTEAHPKSDSEVPPKCRRLRFGQCEGREKIAGHTSCAIEDGRTKCMPQ